MLPLFIRARLCLIVCLAAAGSPLRAQTLDRSLATNSGALARLRVPLLVIDGAHVTPDRGASGGYSTLLSTLASHYDRKAVALDSMTVLAPTLMARIGPPSLPPRPQSTSFFSDALSQFLATLSADQWQQVTSAAGLAAADLTPTQQEWLNRLALAPMNLWNLSRNGETRTVDADERDKGRLRLSRTLTVNVSATEADGSLTGRMYSEDGEQLGDASGHAALPTFLIDREKAKPQKAEGGNHTASEPPVYRYWVPSRLKPGDLDLSETSAASATLARQLSLDSAATLGDLIKRAAAATGWELYSDPRVSRLPIKFYFSAITASRTASIGDVLRAVCWGVSGTFRRVGPVGGAAAYVLTDDRDGIGARLARIEEWDRTASVLSQHSTGKAVEKIASEHHGGQVTFAPDDPFAISKKLLEKLADLQQNPSPNPEDQRIPLGSLPPSLQALLRDEAGLRALDKIPSEIHIEKVGVETSVGLSLLLPGDAVAVVPLGPVLSRDTLVAALAPPKDETRPAAADGPDDSADGTSRKLIRLAQEGKPYVLRMNAATTDEAADAVRLARRFGFARVWLETPGGVNDKPVLTAAIAESAKNSAPPLPVYGVISVLKYPVAAGDDSLDRNILGESSATLARRRAGDAEIEDGGFAAGALKNLLAPPGDWLRFDLPADSEARMQHVLDAADVPGLSGIALADTAPPGYIPLSPDGMDDWLTGLGDSGDFGYSPEARLAFLRAEGYDPIDLCAAGDEFPGPSGGARLPFFPSKKLPRGYEPGYYAENHIRFNEFPVIQWQSARNARLIRFYAALHKRLKDSFPALSLIMAEQSGQALEGLAFWGSWDSPEKLPRNRQTTTKEGWNVSVDPHPTSKFVLESQVVPAGASPSDWAFFFALMLPGGPMEHRPSSGLKADGVLLDLSAMPEAKARSFVEGALAPAYP